MIQHLNDSQLDASWFTSKLTEIEQELTSKRNHIINTIVDQNTVNYLFDENQYYDLSKEYDLYTDRVETNTLLGIVSIEDEQTRINGSTLNGVNYNGVTIKTKECKPYMWRKLDYDLSIFDLTFINEINIIYTANNLINNLFIVKADGIYTDSDKIITATITANNLIISDPSLVKSIYVR